MTTKEIEKKLKISENTCIHCPTFELAKQVLSIFHQLGLKWCDGTDYIKNPNWDSFKKNTVYCPFDGQVSPLEFASFTGYEIISAEEFISLHTEVEEFDLENYEPKGQLIGFPKEVIARMLDNQEKQGNKRDISVFERNVYSNLDQGGFDWGKSIENGIFWSGVISASFTRYPKQEEVKTCSKCHKEKLLSEFHKRGNTVRPECKECRKQEYQESKTAKYVQVGNNTILSDFTSTQSSVEINITEDNSQEFRVGDKVIDIILDLKGEIINVKSNGNLEIQFEGKCGLTEYNLKIEKRASLLHYRDDYNYDVIDFNNLPKRQEPKRWRAKEGEIYYRFTANFDVRDFYHYNSVIDNRDYESGNYFKTKEEAQEVADKLNKYFQELLNTK